VLVECDVVNSVDSKNSEGLTVDEALQRHFGHDSFRPGQAAIVAAILAGRDVLAVRTTGSGKSLCFQLPAVMSSGPTIVVSPLIALMRDQVEGLRRRGIDAAALNSATDRSARSDLLQRLGTRPPRLVYLSPESLATRRVRSLSAELHPARVVVDEAHCISDWGHDFRPDYRKILPWLESVGRPPVAAFTATATPGTRRDIEACLGLRDPVRFVSSIDRPNLRWEVKLSGEPGFALWAIETAVVQALLEGEGASALVYLLSRSGTVQLAHALRCRGVPAVAYHAGMDSSTRSRLQDDFARGNHRVMCATSAFGMGVDHPTIRLVCHLGMPAALEAYVQEAGRAGRDGNPARCLLLPLPGDARLHRSRIRSRRDVGRRTTSEQRAPSHRIATLAHRRLRAMRSYAQARGCRRGAIARYFGEPDPVCTGCDRCGPGG
jgi:ATP-dependent DNA helicase RecQ